MSHEVRVAIVEHAIRWATNILVEVLHNHGRALPQEVRIPLHDAIQKLGDAAQELRS